MDFLRNVIYLIVLITISNCDDSAPAANQNSTATAETPKPSPTPPPIPTPPPVVPTNLICNICDCVSSTVDCSKKGLNNPFTIEDWAGLKIFTPKKVLMNENNLEKLTLIYDLPILILNLSHNKLSAIDRAAFKHLQLMRELDLSYNNLNSAALNPNIFEGIYSPEQYVPLKSMRILKLSHNALHSLHQDAFEHIPELEELRLDNNPFTMIDHVTVVAISSLTYLKTLDLSNCQLKSLPDNFLHTPIHLEWLDLSYNELETVPTPLEEAKSLKYLSLSKNPIKYIGKKEHHTNFPVLPSLKTLLLCHMPKLEEVMEESMAGLQALTVLRMDHNPALRTIHAFAFAKKGDSGKIVPFITNLYLSHNNLSQIESGLIARWDYIEEIDIRENPFLCDCSTQWMVNDLAPIIEKTSPNMTSDIICHDPIEMKGRSMIHMEQIHRKMRCVDAYGDRPERDAAILIGCVIGVLIAVPLVLGIMLMHKRGYFAACGMGGPASFSRAFYKRADNEYI